MFSQCGLRQLDRSVLGLRFLRVRQLKGRFRRQLRIHGLRLQIQMVFNSPLLIYAWVLSRNMVQLISMGGGTRHLSHKQLAIGWIMQMKHLLREGCAKNRRRLLEKAIAKFNGGSSEPTMQWTCRSQSTFNKWVQAMVRGLFWFWTLVIRGCSHPTKGGFWMRSLQMPMQASMFSAIDSWFVHQLQAITWTFSCWRRSSARSWCFVDRWLHMEVFPVGHGMPWLVQCYRIRRFNPFGGRWWVKKAPRG